jgi:hypothetical protein
LQYLYIPLILAGNMVNGYLTRLSKFLESGHAKVCNLVAKVGARKNSLPQVADVVQLSPPNQCYYSVQRSSISTGHNLGELNHNDHNIHSAYASPVRLLKLNITHGETGKHYN